MEQKLQTLNQQNKLTLWSERISACRDSGKSVKTWCKDHNICEATFYKWQKKLFEMVNYQQTCFAEVTPLVQNTVNVKSTCISKMPSQRTFSETASSYLHLLGSTF